ncbi:hypothetical protein LCGC14_1598850 [marine sediment metagenome]|uniref:Uncharacterized protein n=1 Tax=marine sediment metagenome TaxID=412755 RepID=A0A0F9KSI1_9ZZZZ
MPGKLKRRVKELIGGRKTYQKSKIELETGRIKRSLRRSKNRVAKETGLETTAQKERRTRISSPAKKSTPSYGDWLKQTGKGATAATSIQYGKLKRRKR